MTAFLAILTSRLAGPIASTLALVLTLFLVATCTQKAALDRRVDTLTAQIDDPKTGWRARLSQCKDNVTVLDAAVAGQNASIAAMKAESDAASARAAEAVKAAQVASTKARRDAVAIMARRPTGDVCESALALLREP